MTVKPTSPMPVRLRVQHFLRILLIAIMFFPSPRLLASHIVGADMFYTHVSGNTYKITVVLYGDCGTASAGSFGTLPTATPSVCIYNGPTSVATLTLSIEAPSAGVEITPVCAADLSNTQCTNPSFTIPGIKKFTYSATYTLPSASTVWRFIYNGYNNASSSSAGRAAAITNVTPPGTTLIQLIDTLNNATYPNNSNPLMTTVPTPYFCLNEFNSYNPGAVDPNGDNLVFQLVDATNGTTDCISVGLPVTYTGMAWPGQPITAATPLQCLPATYSFTSSTGQLFFTPDVIQRSVVVYNVREFRGGILVGTCQREMTFLVRACPNLPPTGIFDSTNTGVLDDTTTHRICSGSGAFSIYINPVDPEGDSITVTASGLPTGSVFNTTDNGTPAPHSVFTWNATGAAPGSYTFYVTFTDNNCPDAGTLTRAFTVIIDPPYTITGPLAICATHTGTLTGTAGGGTWSSTVPAVGTISATGVVTGISAGTTRISYINSATDCFATAVVTVSPLPTVNPITGPSVLCQGTTITLSNTTTGGTWTVAGPAASIGATTGIVTGMAGGTATVFYTVGNSCGTLFASHTVTVNPLPDPGIISGPHEVCVGNTIPLSESVTGGTWSGGSPNASVSATGVVTGISGGTATISYTTTNGCGSSVATYVITVSATTPDPGTITGPSTLCVSSAMALLASVPGGTWSSTVPAVATVTSGGVVGGISAGTTIISYSLTNACGTAAATKALTVNPLATVDTISGPHVVCQGASITLTNATPGGTWSASGAATVNPTTGVVTGVAGGTASITYSVTNMCSMASAIFAVTVNPLPDPGTITGPDTVCIGSSITLSSSVAGGTWSGGSPYVSVSAVGVVSGLAAGTAIISYTVVNACGPSVATHSVYVKDVPNPAGILSGPADVCVGGSITISSTVPGGTWSSTPATVATVTTAGVVTGVAGGTATISYIVINGCGLTVVVHAVSVNTLPVVDTIAGPSQVCVGTPVTFTNATAGGVWSATGAVSITSGGVVIGASGGTATISYAVTNACGTTTVTKALTVNAAPDAGSIYGPDTVCAGWTIPMTATVPGGSWSTASPGVSVSPTGVVTGGAPGTAVITYTVINGCGVATAVYTLTVTPGTGSPGSISGPSSVCAGSSVTLTAPVAGGTWTSSTPAVGTISTGGVVTGVSGGTTTISYAITDTCGVMYITTVITVNPLPVAAPITGPSSVCAGSFITLSSATPGGAWTGSGPVTVGPGGTVTGASAGTATITYTVTNICGTASVTATVTVNPLPLAGAITGPSTVCVSGTVTLTASVAGGTWSGGSPNASVSATGEVTGVAAGTAVISYTVTTVCGTAIATRTVTVMPTPPYPGVLTGPPAVCAGSTITLTPSVPGGTWSSSPSGVASVAGGVVTGVSGGTATVSYVVSSACGTATTTATVTVDPLPVAAVITGPTSVCLGSSITLSAMPGGGTWSATGGATVTAGGVVTGTAGGLVLISYTVSNSCGTTVATHIVTVNAAPSAGVISGPTTVCVWASITLTSTVPGGTWTSGSPTASVTPSGGIVTGVSAGTALISYTVINACGPAVATYVITVNPSAPAPGPITGPAVVCQGASITLSGAAPGGTWTSTPSSVATVISPGGVVTGISPGTATISYSVASSTPGCGLLTATRIVTVNPLPVVAPLTGPSAVCVGASVTLSSATPGGTWSAGGAATVSGGVVTGLAPGTATISYTVTNACGSTTVTKLVTIDAPPVAGTISGPATVCTGWTIFLTASVPGGTWSGGAPNATVSATGAVTGLAAGTASITYTVTNACGSATATHIVTVLAAPAPSGAITGPLSVCVGSAITLTFPSTLGTWSSGNPSVASVSTGGVVSGLSSGTAIITYSIVDTCGTFVATTVVIVDSLPVVAPIIGPSHVCAGATITLTNATPGGTWSASGGVSVSPAGLVTGLSAGTGTVSYTVSNSCGTSVVTTTITVNPLPTAGTISGPTSVCLGGSTTIPLTSTVPGGAWFGGAPNASVSSTGIVTGLVTGTAVISYLVTNGCGVAVATYIVSVDVPPASGVITGPATVCAGSSITLSASVPGGTWSSSPAAIATVTSTGGVVTGVSAGTAVITYSVTNGCGSAVTTKIVTVNPLPPIAPILGPSAVCLGSSITLTNATPGGVWSASGAATVSSGGIVTGVSGGTAIITYSVAGGLCGPAIATKIVTVDIAPFAGTISGPTLVCPGQTIALVASLPGGTWSTASIYASVSAVGIVTGISGGTAVISYLVVNACGPAVATHIVTVSPAPNPGTISGPSFLCAGATVTLVSTVPGGSWSSGATAVATVSSGGVVTGVAGGTAMITYTVTDGICSSIALFVVNVLSLPNPGVISGGPTVCEGGTLFMTSTMPGGVWSCTSVPTGAATISSIGVLSGLVAGTTTVIYTVSNMCGDVAATRLITIHPSPDPGTITGPHVVCVGATVILVPSATLIGVWSSSNSAIAPVNTIGLVAGESVGVATISYTVTNSFGCSGLASHVVTVAPLPPAAIISGPKQACVAIPVTLTASVPGGTWLSNNPAVAAIDAVSGVVTPLQDGVVTITYTTAPSDMGCVNRSVYTLFIYANAPFAINEYLQHVRCYGTGDGLITLNITGGTGSFKYAWAHGTAAPAISSLSPGAYQVTVTDDYSGCRATKGYTILEPDSLQVSTEVKDEQCKMANGTIALFPAGGTKPYSYTWYDNSTNSNVAGLVKGSYTVTVNDKNLCRKDLRIDIIEGECDDIDVHTGVSPNGDGNNDYWVINGLHNYPDNLVQLYDKWGDLVFEQHRYDNKWNGRGKGGSELPDGTYFYVIRLNAANGAGGKDVLTGALLIKR